MATSPIDVCNIALKRLGADAIVDFTEGSSRASLCAQLYQPTVDRTLREHSWNFAQIRVLLVRQTAVPAWGYANQFTYPTKPLCLKLNEVFPADAAYEIENTIDTGGNVTGKVIVSDETVLYARYTGRIEDVTLWDSSFTDYIALSLAEQMAIPLTESPSLAKIVGDEAKTALSHARTADSQEQSTKVADINILVDVRKQGVNTLFDRSKNKFSF